MFKRTLAYRSFIRKHSENEIRIFVIVCFNEQQSGHNAADAFRNICIIRAVSHAKTKRWCERPPEKIQSKENPINCPIELLLDEKCEGRKLFKDE